MSHRSLRLDSCLFFFSRLYLNWPVFKFADSFFCLVQFDIEPLAEVSNLWASLGHTGRRVALGHTLNRLQHIITKKSHNVLSKFTILCWIAFAILGCMWPMGHRLDTPGSEYFLCHCIFQLQNSCLVLFFIISNSLLIFCICWGSVLLDSFIFLSMIFFNLSICKTVGIKRV